MTTSGLITGKTYFSCRQLVPLFILLDPTTLFLPRVGLEITTFITIVATPDAKSVFAKNIPNQKASA